MGKRFFARAVCGVTLMMVLLPAGCAGKSGSVTGKQSLPEERVAANPVKEIPPDDRKTSLASTRPPTSLSLQPTNRSSAPGTGENGSLQDVLFDFDQAALRPDAVATVESNAKRLAEHGGKRILLEGRGDEVGTLEYNLVLGERRARGVKRYLENLGLDTSKIETTSYGKDRPLCLRHSADCWQKNRSVHFNAGE